MRTRIPVLYDAHNHPLPPLFHPFSFTRSLLASTRFLFLRYSIPRDRLRVYARYTISPVSRRRVALIFKLGALSAVVCQNTGAAYRLYSCPLLSPPLRPLFSLFSLPFILSIYSRAYIYIYIRYSFDLAPVASRSKVNEVEKRHGGGGNLKDSNVFRKRILNIRIYIIYGRIYRWYKKN